MIRISWILHSTIQQQVIFAAGEILFLRTQNTCLFLKPGQMIDRYARHCYAYLAVTDIFREKGEHIVIWELLHWQIPQTIGPYKTLCGAFSESWSINGEAEADIGCLWFLYPFNGSTIKDWLFRPQTMFCLWPFVMLTDKWLCKRRTM